MGESLFKDIRYVEPYVGQHTEPLISSTNMYILMHLQYYLLFAGMCTTIIIIEWIGHRFFFSADKSSVMYNEIPAVCSAVFVIFVATALLTPTSAFSLVLFVLGVTKLVRFIFLFVFSPTFHAHTHTHTHTCACLRTKNYNAHT